MKKYLLVLILMLSYSITEAQDCDEMLQTKIQQYFLNIRSKPDSLNFINCNFIKQRLGTGDVFLDFLSTTLNNEPVFFLTIISKSAPSKFVVIPQSNASQEIISSTGTRSTIRKAVRKSGYEQYENLLQFFADDIQNAQTIYYSTTGDLNLINFKHLRNKANIPLFLNHQLIRLHTAASFLGSKHQMMLSEKMKVLLAGNISYDCDTVSSKTSAFNKTWNYLPGTKTEISDIAKLLSKRHEIRIIDSCNVTETKLVKEINSNGYDVVHIATHGFHIENTDDALGIKATSFPLDRSGIVLTGANNTKASTTTFNPYGLFTASDFTKINLANTKLVVLSTCHSGEGTATQSGAPIGLILSLLRQGSTAMIVSNRAVDDEQARLFMTTFYEQLNSNRSVDECFIKTIRSLHLKNSKVSWDFFDLIH